jgi:hypothetical protein
MGVLKKDPETTTRLEFEAFLQKVIECYSELNELLSKTERTGFGLIDKQILGFSEYAENQVRLFTTILKSEPDFEKEHLFDVLLNFCKNWAFATADPFFIRMSELFGLSVFSCVTLFIVFFASLFLYLSYRFGGFLRGFFNKEKRR